MKSIELQKMAFCAPLLMLALVGSVPSLLAAGAEQCAAGAPAEGQLAKGLDQDYPLGVGDQVVVWALGAEELSEKPSRVGGDGYLDLPLIGRLRAAGLTPGQLRVKVCEGLLPYVRAPRVSVGVTEVKSQPVAVMGSVNKPGVFQVQGRKTLAEILSLAEGTRPDAGSTVRITHPSTPAGGASTSETPTERAAANEYRIKDLLDGKLDHVMVAPHDVVTVSKSPIVYVIGEVKRPGGFAVGDRDAVTVLQALSMAEGLDGKAVASKARLLRAVDGDTTRSQQIIDLTKVLSGKSPDMAMQPDDILFVPDSKVKRGIARAAEAVATAITGVVIYRVGFPR